jgi:hypothetical protein
MGFSLAKSFQHQAPLPLAATLASPYSGSTLFAILLARHSHISSDGEIFPFGWSTPVLCSCGKTQVECPYYREAGAHLLGADGKSWNPALFAPYPTYSRWRAVDTALGRLWPTRALSLLQDSLRSKIRPWQEQDRAFVSAHIQFMENSLRLRQARIYLDGTKSVRRALLFAASPQVSMKIIHLVRDGRGFCFSYLKNRKLSRAQLPLAAREWNNNIKTIDRLKKRLPHVPILNVRYEDLCRDLPATLVRVCQFLEVPYEPALESSEGRPCHVLGNRMRLNFSGQVEECLRWQQELTAREIDYLNRALREGLERYHYAPSAGDRDEGEPPADIGHDHGHHDRDFAVSHRPAWQVVGPDSQ